MHRQPRHLAFIVDGNRRWARAHQMSYFNAYKVAGNNLVNNVCYAAQQGVRVVTAFLFSTENWNRDEDGVVQKRPQFRVLLRCKAAFNPGVRLCKAFESHIREASVGCVIKVRTLCERCQVTQLARCHLPHL